MQGPAADTTVQAGLDAPQMSTVLVVDAVNRHQRQHPGAPVRIADVAERLDVAPSTASRLVDRAAKAGMLVRDAVNRHQRQRPGAPVRIADVAERLDVAPSTASRLVDRAAKAGMLVRDADPADSRRAALVLTAAGGTLSERALTFRTGSWNEF